MNDRNWDRKLHIHTVGRNDKDATEHCFPYEPTPYAVLERLAGAGYIKRNNCVLDYGCGLGRVCFFLAAMTGCEAIGVDFSERLVQKAQDNRMKFAERERVMFLHCYAEQYMLHREDRIFFFNPFTAQILRSVLGKIRRSRSINPREIYIFCYYPSDEFVATLMTEPDICFIDEIDCRDLFDGANNRERLLVFSFGEEC